MPRGNEEDSLEPILPKHPPTQRDEAPPVPELEDLGPAPVAMPVQSWERMVFIACAVVATLALVVIAARAGTIVQEERRQSCQQRAFIEGDRDDIRDAMARCDGEAPDTTE